MPLDEFGKAFHLVSIQVRELEPRREVWVPMQMAVLKKVEPMLVAEIDLRRQTEPSTGRGRLT
jgi:hypothetical protein